MVLIKYYYLALFPLLSIGQDLDIKVGLEYKPNLLFQRIETGKYQYFDKNWSLDVSNGIGVKIEADLYSVSFGMGLHYTGLGFNKNNPDSTHSFFTSRKNPYYLQKLKYRANYMEVPFSLHYRFTHKLLNLNVGFSYSYYKFMDSFVKASYHEINMDERSEEEVQQIMKFLMEDTRKNWYSFYPYAELEIKFGKVSIAPKIGVRLFSKQYHEILDKSWIIMGGFSFNYYL